MDLCSPSIKKLSQLLNTSKPNIVEKVEITAVEETQQEPKVVRCRLIIHHQVQNIPNPASVTFPGIRCKVDDPLIGLTERGFQFKYIHEGRNFTVTGQSQ